MPVHRFNAVLTTCCAACLGAALMAPAGAQSDDLKAGATLEGPLGMTFVYIPAGKFRMGSDKGEPDETPMHRVTFNRGFYVSATEVTQGQWKAVMGENPSGFPSCGDDCPVDSVSWDDAQEFIRKLNEKDPGKRYRLPSEAEWEYACRAGTLTETFWKTEAPDAYCWYDTNSEKTPHAVKGRKPNPWGVYDMLGNLWEWCEDVYIGSYEGAPSDGIARASGGEENRRVARGGSWSSNGWSVRAANRMPYPKDLRYSSLGFRLVRELR